MWSEQHSAPVRKGPSRIRNWSLLTTALMGAPRVRSSQPRYQSRGPSRNGAATKPDTPTDPADPPAETAPDSPAHSRRCAGVRVRSSRIGPSCRRLPVNYTGNGPAPLDGRKAGTPALSAPPTAAGPCAKAAHSFPWGLRQPSHAHNSRTKPSRANPPAATPVAATAPSPAPGCGAQSALPRLTGVGHPVSTVCQSLGQEGEDRVRDHL